MKSYDVVGYAYDAALHCVACASERFGDPDAEGLEDSEGNPVHPYFAGEAGEQDGETCNDCGEAILED
jgi:hypothetical protein